MYSRKNKPNDRSSNRRSPSRDRRSRPDRKTIDDIAKRAKFMKKMKMAGGACVLVVLGVMAYPYFMVLAKETKIDIASYCYDNLPRQSTTAVFIEAATSNLFSTKGQLASIANAMVADHKNTNSYKRFEVFTNGKETASDFIKPFEYVCKPPSTVVEHRALQQLDPNILDKDQPQIEYLVGEAFKDFDGAGGFANRVIAQTRTKSEDTTDRWSAALLSTMKSISRYYENNSNTLEHLIMYSDGIEASSSLSMCKKVGHLPSWKNFTKRPLYQKIKPFSSFNGIKVTVLMPEVLTRYSMGNYCTQDELYDFWKSYWLAAGASDVDVQLLKYHHANHVVEAFGNIEPSADKDQILLAAADTSKHSNYAGSVGVADGFALALFGYGVWWRKIRKFV